MVAELKILKYVGKSAIFGTEVSSIGLKRIDSVVPAVYGNPIVPGDDKSDILRYPILVPDDGNDDDVYSFESIFKLHLKVAPDNRLTNIRIYPEGPAPEGANLPSVFIGTSPSFTRPTNGKSLVAIHDIWSFTEEAPFPITIGGAFGYAPVVEDILLYEYQVTVSDPGSGNVYFLDAEETPTIQMVLGKTYVFVNNFASSYPLRIYDIALSYASHGDIVYSNSGLLQIVTIQATESLILAFPNGFKYGSLTNPNMGGDIEWVEVELESDTIEYVVETRPDWRTYFNGIRAPILDLQIGKTYVFTNITGDEHPFRLFESGDGGSETNVIVDGITVTGGGTTNEVITVDTIALFASGKVPVYYGSTVQHGTGKAVRLFPLLHEGNYNLNTVGAGPNPTAAGETDFIYLQMAINKDTVPGNFIPNIIIKYDEA